MRVKTKLLMLGIYGLALIAACSATGCSTHSSINGRETWGIGIMQIREGRGDTNYAWGAPADESTQTHARASEIIDGPSASMQAVYSQKGGR